MMLLSLLLIVLVIISIVISTYGEVTIDTYNVQLNNVFSSNDAYVVLYYMGNDDQSKNFGTLMENMKQKLIYIYIFKYRKNKNRIKKVEI